MRSVARAPASGRGRPSVGNSVTVLVGKRPSLLFAAYWSMHVAE